MMSPRSLNSGRRLVKFLRRRELRIVVRDNLNQRGVVMGLLRMRSHQNRLHLARERDLIHHIDVPSEEVSSLSVVVSVLDSFFSACSSDCVSLSSFSVLSSLSCVFAPLV